MINSLGEIFFRWMWGESCCGGSGWVSDIGHWELNRSAFRPGCGACERNRWETGAGQNRFT